MSIWKDFIYQERLDRHTNMRALHFQHASGFGLTLLQKPGFTQRSAVLLIPYGATLQKIKRDDSEEEFDLPAGTAHLVEHLVFAPEKEGQAAIAASLAQKGVELDAWTSYQETFYTLQATRSDSLFEGIQILWQRLEHASIDPERFEREREVVTSEWALYEDDPETAAWQALMASLYRRRELRVDILGSKADLEAIQLADVERYWRYAYQAQERQLVLVGDYPQEELEPFLAWLHQELEKAASRWRPFSHLASPSQPEVAIAMQKLQLPVEQAQFYLAYKDPRPKPESPLQGLHLTRQQQVGELFAQCFFGESSPLFQQLYDGGYLNDSFSASYICEADYAFLVLSGEAEDPEKTMSLLEEAWQQAWRSKEDPDLATRFERQRRVLLGQFFRELDQVESCAHAAALARRQKADLLDYPHLYQQLQVADLFEQMRFMQQATQVCKLAIFPKEV